MTAWSTCNRLLVSVPTFPRPGFGIWLLLSTRNQCQSLLVSKCCNLNGLCVDFVSSKGEFGKAVTLPHTITTWVGRALCVSESHGFGMTAAVDIEAFQPFFVEVHLPYSVKRTEKLQLKISVFNYAPHSLPIRLTLAYSEQFELISDSDSTLLCVPARNNVVHHFVIHAIEIGKHNVSVSATIDDNFPGECGPEILPSARYIFN